MPMAAHAATATVMVVDDSQTTATAAASVFTAEGLRVLTARGGTGALQLVASNEVSLVLLDLELPTLDGLHVLKLLRAAQARRYLPIIMMSVTDDRQKRTAAFRLGADDFVVKPWHAEELLLRAKRCLDLRARF